MFWFLVALVVDGFRVDAGDLGEQFQHVLGAIGKFADAAGEWLRLGTLPGGSQLFLEKLKMGVPNAIEEFNQLDANDDQNERIKGDGWMHARCP